MNWDFLVTGTTKVLTPLGKIIDQWPGLVLCGSAAIFLHLGGCEAISPTTVVSPTTGEKLTQDELQSELNRVLNERDTFQVQLKNRITSDIQLLEANEIQTDQIVEAYKDANESINTRKAERMSLVGQVINTVSGYIPGSELAAPLLLAGLAFDSGRKEIKIRRMKKEETNV